MEGAARWRHLLILKKMFVGHERTFCNDNIAGGKRYKTQSPAVIFL